MTENNTQTQFAPFHAINEFMLPEYRREVIHQVLSRMNELPEERRKRILDQLKHYLRLPGFRNSLAAPLGIKVKGSDSVFEQHPDFVAQILMGWSELHGELRAQVYDLLIERKWELLPPEADRTRLPGFLVRWPKEETYDALDAAFAARFPEAHPHEYDVRLMIVWISGRLPYDMVESE